MNASLKSTSNLSDLCLDSYRAADDWFEALQLNTQTLLETYRKDRMRMVKISILDTGIDRGHPGIEAQWAKRIKGVKSWINGEKGDKDTCGHGTHAAALLMKVAPEASIYIARVVKEFSSLLDSDNVASVCHLISLFHKPV